MDHRSDLSCEIEKLLQGIDVPNEDLSSVGELLSVSELPQEVLSCGGSNKLDDDPGSLVVGVSWLAGVDEAEVGETDVEGGRLEEERKRRNHQFPVGKEGT